MRAAEDRASPTPALSTLAYGAANLGNLFRPLTDAEATAILETAWESGIRYFDTAPHYGLGLSERRLGEFLRTKPRDEFVLSTKAGRLLRPNPDDDGGLDLAADFHVRTSLRREWDLSAEGVRTSLEESLERLGLDRVDILYLHDPERHDLEQAVAEALPGLEQLRADGVVRAVGVGSMVADAVETAVRAADLDVVMIAGRHTLIEPDAAQGALGACRERGVDVVAASVFNSGLLASATPERSARYEYGDVPDGVWDRLQRILAVCRAWDVPLPAAAVQFPLRERAVASVVVGASRPDHLRQNAAYMSSPIPEGFWDELTAAGLIPA